MLHSETVGGRQIAQNANFYIMKWIMANHNYILVTSSAIKEL